MKFYVKIWFFFDCVHFLYDEPNYNSVASRCSFTEIFNIISSRFIYLINYLINLLKFHCLSYQKENSSEKNRYIFFLYIVIRHTIMIPVDFAEAFRPPMFRTGKDKDGFSLGKYNNFQEVFGDNSRLWFLPVFTR